MNPDYNEKISKLLSTDRYKYFIKTIAETSELWTLIDTDGAFALFEVENTTVISLWSDETYIESNLTPDWADCIPFKMDIDALQEILIPLIRQNDYRINAFPVDSRIGYIVTLNNFVEDLNREL